METPPPSRIQERQENPEDMCLRMHMPRDPQLADLFFKVAAETLPTRARLHHLNPRRWENPNCDWCDAPATPLHMFIECPRTRELWEWLRGMVVTIEPASFRWQDQQLLNLRFPTTPHARAISYLTMTTVKKMWDFIRQHRQLSVNRMTALIRNDLKIRQQMNLPDINVNL